MSNNISNLSFPRLYGLLADKPSSLSQAMHNAGFSALGINSFYVNFDTLNTKDALSAVRCLGICGLSLTIPHKENAFSHVDTLDQHAQTIGAINTIINDGSSLTGFNTDWVGIVKAFDEAKADVKDKRILIIGAGGAARAAVYAMQKMGSKEIYIFNRSPERASALASCFSVHTCILQDLVELGSRFDVVINCTPVGSKLASAEAHPFNLRQLSSKQIVFDMVTKESTQLLDVAKEQESKVISGARMLLFQALEQFHLFTNLEPPKEAMESALYAALANNT